MRNGTAGEKQYASDYQVKEISARGIPVFLTLPDPAQAGQCPMRGARLGG